MMKLTDEEKKAIVALLQVPASRDLVSTEHVQAVAGATGKDSNEANQMIESLQELHQVIDNKRQAKPDETWRWALTPSGLALLADDAAEWLRSRTDAGELAISSEGAKIGFALPGTNRSEMIHLPFAPLEIARIAAKDGTICENVLAQLDKVVRELKEKRRRGN